MSTSLAEQLRRLAAPQTQLLHDGRKRASLLFDPSEAAEKDRETIYDIGLSGLHDLIQINPTFVQFEMTLFERTTKELERAVEDSELNTLLNRNIKKFMLQLSPYFLMRPAHKALEWLIRRFHIHLYNKDEVMMLILPYHETKMFVKVLQLLRINDKTDKRWHWLQPMKKLGQPLSKQQLFARVASDSNLLKFICKLMVAAVDELDVNAVELQTLFSFYYLTIIGALETAAEVTDSHITDISPSVLKGLASRKDFCGASIMIITQIIRKVQLSDKLLQRICFKLTKMPSPSLHKSAVMLLILIYKLQNRNNVIEQNVLLRIIESKWFLTTLGELYSEDGMDIMPLYEPLLINCLKIVQLKEHPWQLCKQFCENLLNEIQFIGQDTESNIRCLLNGYILWETNEESTITIDSDEDDAASLNRNSFNVNEWYSSLLKNWINQYPEIFDRLKKEIMHKQPSSDESVGARRKRQSLKTILGFIYSINYSHDHTAMFENLYHYNAANRIDAVKYLCKNLEQLCCISDDSKDLLKDSICERLMDSSAQVTDEILKLPIKTLLNIIGGAELLDYLQQILERSKLESIVVWEQSIARTLQYLTSAELLEQIEKNNVDTFKNKLHQILIIIFPYLFPQQNIEFQFFKIIIDSEFAKHFEWLKQLKSTQIPNAFNQDLMEKQIKNCNKPLCDLNELLAVIKLNEQSNSSGKSSDENVSQTDTKRQATYKSISIIVLLTYSLNENSTTVTQIQDVFKILCNIYQFDNLEIRKTFQYNNQIKRLSVFYYSTNNNSLPLQLYSNCIEMIIKLTDFTTQTQLNDNTKMDFSKNNIECKFLTEILLELIVNAIKSDNATHKEMLINLINKLFDRALPNINNKIEYFSNYFIIECLDGEQTIINMDIVQQIRTLRFFIKYIQHTEYKNKNIKIDFNIKSFIRILYGLCSTNVFIRQLAYEFIEISMQFNVEQLKYKYFIQHLMHHQQELQMDSNQLSLIMFMLYTDVQKKQRSSIEAESINELFKELFDFIASNSNESSPPSSSSPSSISDTNDSKTTNEYFHQGLLLEILQHINKTSILQKISNCALNIIMGKHSKSMDFDGLTATITELEPMYFDQYQSKILKYILIRYGDASLFKNNNIIKLLKENDCWLTIFYTIKNYNSFMRINEKQKSSVSIQQFLLTNVLLENNCKFFKELNGKQKISIFNELIRTSAITNDSKSIAIIRKFVKNMELDCKLLLIDFFQSMISIKIQHQKLQQDDDCIVMLDDMELQQMPPSKSNQPKPKQRVNNKQVHNEQQQYEITDRNISQKLGWKCGVSLLEHLQNKRNLLNVTAVIPILFDLLQKCLEFNVEQSTIEYTKQLILSCLLHFCQQIASAHKPSEILKLKNLFKIEYIIQCIRGTQNPQTQHHALLLLELAAQYQSEQVLHNMMNIFTFMGSSIVRHDDEYSFQIILNIITTIIPTLIKPSSNNNIELSSSSSSSSSMHDKNTAMQKLNYEKKQIELILPILKIFTDVILDIPEHRRIPLYKKLIDTLNSSGTNYLWMFLSCLFESHIRNDLIEKQQRKSINQPVPKNRHQQEQQQLQIRRKIYPTLESNNTSGEYPKRIEIALQLIIEFNCNDILLTCLQLLNHLQTLPNEIIAGSVNTSQKTIDQTLFNVTLTNDYQLRHYKYTILLFIKSLTSSIQFLNKISVLNENHSMEAENDDEETISDRIEMDIEMNNPEDDDENKRNNITLLYKQIITKILEFIQEFLKLSELNANTPQFKTWKIILNHCYDILENAISLLTPEMLLIIIYKILKHNVNVPNIQRKTIEILNNKLQYKADYFVQCEDAHLMKILPPLNKIIESILQSSSPITSSSSSSADIVAVDRLTNELQSLQHNALIASKLLSKSLAQSNPMAFKQLLELLTEIVRNKNCQLSINIRTAVILCLAEICSNLKAHSIAYLSKFMPSLLTFLQQQIESKLQIDIINGIITAMQKIIETLALFLSPYLVNIICGLSKLSICLQQNQQQQKTQKQQQPQQQQHNQSSVSYENKIQIILTKLNVTWETLAGVLPLRVIIPAISESYKNILENKQYDGIDGLMKLLMKKLANQTNDEINPFQSDLVNFFMSALRFRCDHQQEGGKRRSKLQQQQQQQGQEKKQNDSDDEKENAMDEDDEEIEGNDDDDDVQMTNVVDDDIILINEDHIIQAFITFILKLSESSFRPLYFKIYDWAIRDVNSDKILAITFYKLSWKIAEALKSLFVLFANSFLANAVDLLNQCNTSKLTLNLEKRDKNESTSALQSLYFNDQLNCKQLIEYILQTFNLIFIHANQGFLNSHRFEMVLQPIVDQLENDLIHQNVEMKALLMECLSHLVGVVKDDTMWKRLNYQILLKTRNNNSEIRIYGLMVCVEVAKKLGENFLPLLPETVPFIAELLEDENVDVEKKCKKCVHELEKILGEPIQKYF